MLAWLRTMQLDPIGDDPSLRALLKLPPYKAPPANGMLGPRLSLLADQKDPTAHFAFQTSCLCVLGGLSVTSTAPANGTAAEATHKASKSKHDGEGHSSLHKGPKAVLKAVSHIVKAAVPLSLASTSAGGTNSATVSVSAETAPVTPNTGSAAVPREVQPSVVAAAAAAAVTATALAADTVAGATEIQGDPAQYVSPCGCWKGRTVESFRWLDLTTEAKDMYIDIKYTHDFKVRGGTYLSNKKKVCDDGYWHELSVH
jgi:hypothetical protein